MIKSGLLFSFLLLLLLLTACTAPIDKADNTLPVNEEHNILVIHENNPNYADLKQLFVEPSLFSETITKLNTSLELKRDLYIIFKDCMTGEYSGPYPPNYPTSYDSSSNSITICYNALQELNDFASSMGIEGGQQDQKSTNEIIEKMALFFLTHEMGHALLNELNLTPNEADSHQITLTLAPKLNIVGEEIILMPPMASIGLFYLKGLDYYETHLIQLEDYACWVYGQDPQKYAILQSNWITSEREKTCVQEYKEITDKWNPILAPVLKN